MSLRDQLDDEIKGAVDEIQKLIAQLKDLQAKKTKQIEARHQLGSQTGENELVRNELEQLDESAKVFKLIGPALISQEPKDALVIVQKRLEFISKETKRCEQLIQDYDKQEENCRQHIMGLQQKVQARSQQISAAAGEQVE